MIPDPAANDPPTKRLRYAEIFFTPGDLMLEYDLTIDQARAFLTRYELWISEAMQDADDVIIRQLAHADHIDKYDDI